jgi:hypothetical protein
MRSSASDSSLQLVSGPASRFNSWRTAAQAAQRAEDGVLRELPPRRRRPAAFLMESLLLTKLVLR